MKLYELDSCCKVIQLFLYVVTSFYYLDSVLWSEVGSLTSAVFLRLLSRDVCVHLTFLQQHYGLFDFIPNLSVYFNSKSLSVLIY